MFRFEVVQEALGGRPPKSFFTGNTDQQNLDIITKVLDAYDRHRDRLPQLRQKSPGTFRPAFVSDYIDPADGTAPHARESEFVFRGLIYSDSVAVPDGLSFWSQQRHKEKSEHFGWGFGSMGFPNGIADIYQVLAYAEYEKAGLLEYYTRPESFLSRDSWKEAGESLPHFPLGSEADFLTRMQLALHAHMGLSELFKNLCVLGEHPGDIDLYLPDWTLPDFTLDWLLHQIDSAGRSWPTSVNDKSIGEAQTFREVMALPSPGMHAFEELSIDQLVAVRSSKYFNRFRDDIREIASEYTEGRSVSDLHSAALRTQLSAKIQRSRERFIQDHGRRGLDWNSIVKQGFFVGGISTAGAAGFSAMTHQALVSNSVLTAIPFAGALTPALWDAARWLLGDERALSAADVHYKAFMVG